MSPSRRKANKRAGVTDARERTAGASAAPGEAAGVHPLSWVSAAGIAAIAVLRCVAVVSPDTAFATDPYIDPGPTTSLGPVGSVWLDAMLIVFAALGFIGEGLSRRRIDVVLLVLAALPIPVVLWHGVGEFDDLWRGFSWVAAAMAAVTAAHLARQSELRLLMAAALGAAVVPLCVRGLVQVFIEHPEMVETYERNRDTILAARGIDTGSSSARVFETRLYQPEATAWFGLANVLGSFFVAGLTIWAGWMIATIRARLESGFAGVMGIVALLCATGLILAGSKGAFAAAGVGLALLAMPHLMRGLTARRDAGPPRARAAGWVGIAVVGLAVLGVVVRGAILPESFAGERSILFRWHYWIGAGRMIAENPVAGVGPGGFQDAFVQNRLAITPEEAASAHNVFIDWLTTLGISGLGWVAMVVLLLWRAGLCLLGESSVERQDELAVAGAEKRTTSWIAMIALGAFAPALLIEEAALDARAVFFRALGIMGYLAAAGIAAKALRRSGSSLAWWSIAAGAIALFTHAQIEVTITHAGAAAWGLTLVGVASARPREGTERSRVGTWIGASLLAAVTAVAVIFMIPAWRQSREMDRAAIPLRELGMVRVALLSVAESSEPEARAEALIQLLESAGRAGLSAESIDSIRASQAMTRESLELMLMTVGGDLRQRESITRRDAAERLVIAYEMMESNARPLRYSIEQMMAIDPGAGEARRDVLREAADRADLLTGAHPSAASIALAARVFEQWAESTGDPAHIERAIALRRRLTELDPHGISPRVALADLLARFGRMQEAQEEYGRVLEQSDRWYLDEVRQLTEEERQRIEAIILDMTIDVLKRTLNDG